MNDMSKSIGAELVWFEVVDAVNATSRCKIA